MFPIIFIAIALTHAARPTDLTATSRPAVEMIVGVNL